MGRVDEWQDIEACFWEMAQFPIQFSLEGNHIELVSFDLEYRSKVGLNVAARMYRFNKNGNKVLRIRAVYLMILKKAKRLI